MPYTHEDYINDKRHIGQLLGDKRFKEASAHANLMFQLGATQSQTQYAAGMLFVLGFIDGASDAGK